MWWCCAVPVIILVAIVAIGVADPYYPQSNGKLEDEDSAQPHRYPTPDWDPNDDRFRKDSPSEGD